MRSKNSLPGSALVLLLIASLLSGCGLLPRSEFTRPVTAVPDRWQEGNVSGMTVANHDQWWKNFNDPLLDTLIEWALKTNNDLAAATIKVRRAQLESGLTDTNLTPSVNVSGSGGGSLDIRGGKITQSYSALGSLSYEVDLWGRLASLRDSGSWEAKATKEDRRSTALSLIGTTATAYWQVAYLNERIASGEASLAYVEKTLDLVRVKYRSGAVSGIELAQAQRTVANQKAELTRLRQQRAEARNALSLLFDQAPENRVEERERLPDGPLPAIEVGIPADLLGRRPDLRAAEMRLREYLANVDATRASFYPTFTLTGSLGGSSISLENVLRNPVATLGAGLALPFVQWNTARLTTDISKTRYEEAVVTFRQTLYTALAEVEDTLSAAARYREESVLLEQSVELSRTAEQLAEIRYRSGATGVQSWLDEQERRRNAETSLLENRCNRLKNMMKLYQALGGDQRG
jgi:NodT family efflux transporter outer membrane factor (OMF) lipoprotein